MLSCRGLFSGGAAQVLDKDGSGSISTDELREALSGLSSGLEAAEMDEASIGEIVISMAHSLDSDTP